MSSLSVITNTSIILPLSRMRAKRLSQLVFPGVEKSRTPAASSYYDDNDFAVHWYENLDVQALNGRIVQVNNILRGMDQPAEITGIKKMISSVYDTLRITKENISQRISKLGTFFVPLGLTLLALGIALLIHHGHILVGGLLAAATFVFLIYAVYSFLVHGEVSLGWFSKEDDYELLVQYSKVLQNTKRVVDARNSGDKNYYEVIDQNPHLFSLVDAHLFDVVDELRNSSLVRSSQFMKPLSKDEILEFSYSNYSHQELADSVEDATQFPSVLAMTVAEYVV